MKVVMTIGPDGGFGDLIPEGGCGEGLGEERVRE